MEDNSEKVVKATLWYTVSNILLRGISLFTAPIFTRLLSTADYGIASNFTSWAAVIACFTGLGLGTAVIRGKIEFNRDYKKYLSSVQFLGMIWCGICIVILLAGITIWSPIMSLDNACIVFMAGYLFFSPSLTYGQIDIRFDYKYKENVAISVLSTIINVGVAIGLILLWNDKKYLGRIVGIVFPSLLFGAWLAVRIFRQGRCYINRAYWKYALKLSVPMIPHGLAMIVLGQIDRIMIISYCGESEAGIYSFGYSYAVLLSVVTNAINDAVQPQMYEMMKSGEEEKMSSYVYRLMLLGVLLTVGIIGVGPEALRILGTQDYYDARWIIFPVAVGTFMQYVYQFFGLMEVYSKKTGYMAVGSCGAAIINYLLNMVYIPQYGYMAAAYTTFISYTLLMIFHFVMARVAYGKYIFKALPICSIIMLCIAGGAMLLYFYDYIFIIRYILILVFVIVIGYQAKEIISNLICQVMKKVREKGI